MFSTILIVMAVLLILFIVAATYFLWPIPLLSYRQGDIQTERGTVVSIKKIRPGVTKVEIKHSMQIDPKLQKGNPSISSVSCSTYIHFRGNQQLPKKGDYIEATSVNRLHHFTGHSYNWIKSWKKHEGAPVPEGWVTAF